MSFEQFANDLADATDDEIIRYFALRLRHDLKTSVDYGYDAVEREFFWNVRDYNCAAYIKHKYVRQRRYDLIARVEQELINKVQERMAENVECES